MASAARALGTSSGSSSSSRRHGSSKSRSRRSSGSSSSSTSATDVKAFQAAPAKAMYGHHKNVLCVRWNSSGSMLGSSSADCTCRLWSIDKHGDGKECGTLRGHSDTVDHLCWHPSNDNVLATASADKTVRIWDTRTCKSTSTLNMTGQNINIAWSPDGRTMAVGNKDDCISLIDVRKRRAVRKVRFQVEINEIAWASNSLLFMSQSIRQTGVEEGLVQVMKCDSKLNLTPVLKIPAHTGSTYCLNFDPTGQYFATGGGDGNVCVFDALELACVRTFDRLETGLRSVCFSHDSQLIATSSEEPFVDVLRVSDGTRVRSVATPGPTNFVTFHPKRYLLAYACDDKGISSHDVGAVRVVGIFS